MSKPRKGLDRKTTVKTTVKMPQPHGGALNAGGILGNKGGAPGAPPPTSGSWPVKDWRRLSPCSAIASRDTCRRSGEDRRGR
jgi:hypothetical protein